MSMPDFEDQRTDALTTLDDENVDQFILLADYGGQTKMIVGSKQIPVQKQHPFDMLSDAQKMLFKEEL